MEQPLEWFVGIDWGAQEHALCVVDPSGKVVSEGMYANTAEGIARLIEELLGRAGQRPETVGIGIETRRVAIAEVLVERKFAVFAINPKQVDRFRDRFSPSGAKDDRRDALVLASALRTDQTHFRRIEHESAELIRLRDLSRLRDELLADERRQTNRLRDLLMRVVPDLVRLCPGADEEWLWDLLERARTPEALARIKANTLGRLLKARRIRRLHSDDLVNVLRQPRLQLAPGTAASIAEQIELLLPRLRLAHDQVHRVDARLGEALDNAEGAGEPEGQKPEHHDVKILRSLPAFGKVVAAVVLGEAAQLLRNRDYASLRLIAGTAPVTFASGKRSGRRATVVMRRACNTRLRGAIHHWAFSALNSDPASRSYFERLRARGCSAGRALRSVGDRLLRIAVACLSTGTTYDPAKCDRPLLAATA